MLVNTWGVNFTLILMKIVVKSFYFDLYVVYASQVYDDDLYQNSGCWV